MKLFFGEVFPEVRLDEQEAHHISKVLRMKDGEEIVITDGKGNSAVGNLILHGKKVEIKVKEVKNNHSDFPVQLHIAIAPTKNMDRIEFFVEKATELGISEISFLQTENSERSHLKIEKIQKQVIAASMQSLRFYFPKVNPLIKLSDFLLKTDSQTTFVAHCNEILERKKIQDINPKKSVTFLVGPEGDFSEKEIKMLAEKGIVAVSLGNQRLRTETAGIYITAWNYGLMM